MPQQEEALGFAELGGSTAHDLEVTPGGEG